MASNRRHFERQTCDVPVVIRDPDLASSPYHTAHVENVSEEGIGVRASTTLVAGDRIRIYPWDNGPGVPARVMWSRTLSTATMLAGCKLEDSIDRLAFGERRRRRERGYSFWLIGAFVLALASLVLTLANALF